ncbi:hypothetical protein CVT26_001373 [Gymnopilus dilepis]|uniref:Uncharacterized protein n=1 Tax=Gymnopilus dilepis TaxID=231916 RepID=A0A409YUJ7_9AGAR|nr:hypothetical protein CVT26_001373 [Gymnopilus dilepis]
MDAPSASSSKMSATDEDSSISDLTHTPGESAQRPEIPDSIAAPSTTRRSSTSLPDLNGQRPRKRKLKTQEAAPLDSPSVMALGMTPFMPGQDAMFNQNRLVRNEVVLSRHVANLQSSFSRSESSHAGSFEDVYRILTDHKKILDRLEKEMQDHSVFTSNKELDALSAAVKAIERFLATSAQFALTSLSDLNETVTRLLPEDQVPSVEEASRRTTPGNLTSQNPDFTERLPKRSFTIPDDSFTTRDAKRRREDFSGAISPRQGRNTPLKGHAFGEPSYANIHVLPNPSLEVVYGPIKDTSDPREAVEEAVRVVGLSLSTIQSVQATLGRPAFFTIRFTREEHARTFVSAVGLGLDGYLLRRADFAHEFRLAGPSGTALSTASTPTLGSKPWLL